MSERAALVIRAGRAESGLTQRELASRLHIAAARISDDETSKVDPSVDTLDRIVTVAGLDLVFVLRPQADSRTRRRAQLQRLAAKEVDRSRYDDTPVSPDDAVAFVEGVSFVTKAEVDAAEDAALTAVLSAPDLLPDDQ